jgi:hypothetical protein
MNLEPEQEEIFNNVLDLVYTRKKEEDVEKKTQIQHVIESEKNKLMKSMPFRDYISFMREASPLFI